MPVMQILADTTNQIAEGEVLQLLHVRNPDTDEAAYLRVIERKTAVLFAAATRLGALLAGAGCRRCSRRLHDYGMNLGCAFQIADDVLDYTADADTLGKNLGDDLAEGKATLPVIHALAHASPAERPRARPDHPRRRLQRAAGSACSHPGQRQSRLQPPGGRTLRIGRRCSAGLIAANEWSNALRGADALRDQPQPLAGLICAANRSAKKLRIILHAAPIARLMELAARQRAVLVGFGEAMHGAAEVDELPVAPWRRASPFEGGDRFGGNEFVVGAVQHQHRRLDGRRRWPASSCPGCRGS